MKCNQDYVAHRPGEETSWYFNIPASAESQKSLYNETISVLNGCFDVFSDFIKPTDIKFFVLSSDSEYPCNKLISGDPNSTNKTIISVTSSDGVRRNEAIGVVRNYEHPDNPKHLVVTVKFESPLVRVSLSDGDEYVGKHSSNYRLDSESESKSPSEPPLSIFISLYHSPKGFYHSVTVSTHTDLWFEDSEYGKINQERLREFLNDLCHAVGASRIDYDSETRSVPFELDWNAQQNT